jgi:HK97 family phage major capsid protein
VLASGATRIDTQNRVIHVPRVLSDAAADWYGELEEIVPGDPTGDDLVLTPKKCAALTKLSGEAVSGSMPAVLDVVGAAMTRAVGLEADAAILIGTGGKTADRGRRHCRLEYSCTHTGENPGCVLSGIPGAGKLRVLIWAVG